jgi:hypothetical protein
MADDRRGLMTELERAIETWVPRTKSGTHH